MNGHFIVNLFKSVAATVVFVVFFFFSIVMFLISRPVSAILFLVMGAVFGYVALINGMAVNVDENGISKSLFGFVTMKFNWEDVAEIGVCGTKVFNKNHKDRVGTLYVYISPSLLSEQDRFEMILKWPPKDKIYFVFKQKHLELIQMVSGLKTEVYNTGDLTV